MYLCVHYKPLNEFCLFVYGWHICALKMSVISTERILMYWIAFNSNLIPFYLPNGIFCLTRSWKPFAKDDLVLGQLKIGDLF
jgi:hypothetical protein